MNLMAFICRPDIKELITDSKTVNIFYFGGLLQCVFILLNLTLSCDAGTALLPLQFARTTSAQ